MDVFEKEQYKNLRGDFNYLIDTILGKDYYNTEMDVYSSDDTCVRHILTKFNQLETEVTKYKILSMVLGVCSIGMTLLYVLS